MTPAGAEPVGRIRFMDRQRVNLDGFAIEDPELGLTALRSPHDPAPNLVVEDGRVAELDGVPDPDGFVELRPADLTATLHALTGWALEHRATLDTLQIVRPSLEDVYLHLTDGAPGSPS